MSSETVVIGVVGKSLDEELEWAIGSNFWFSWCSLGLDLGNL